MRAAVVVIMSLLAACAGDDATSSTGRGNGSANAPSTTVTSNRVVPDGFTRTAAVVTTSDGDICELCLWLADDADQRRRGLMFVTDLGEADGMAFRYPEATTRRFWMKNTVLALSIAFFGPDGTYLDAFDMEPCAGDPCPRFRTPTDFVVAVEVLRGGLDELGITPGSTLELLDTPCAN